MFIKQLNFDSAMLNTLSPKKINELKTKLREKSENPSLTTTDIAHTTGLNHVTVMYYEKHLNGVFKPFVKETEELLKRELSPRKQYEIYCAVQNGTYDAYIGEIKTKIAREEKNKADAEKKRELFRLVKKHKINLFKAVFSFALGASESQRELAMRLGVTDSSISKYSSLRRFPGNKRQKEFFKIIGLPFNSIEELVKDIVACEFEPESKNTRYRCGVCRAVRAEQNILTHYIGIHLPVYLARKKLSF